MYQIQILLSFLIDIKNVDNTSELEKKEKFE